MERGNPRADDKGGYYMEDLRDIECRCSHMGRPEPIFHKDSDGFRPRKSIKLPSDSASLQTP